MTMISTQIVVRALREVRDPCMDAAGLDISIVDMGLIYGVQLESGVVRIRITFTEPGCPYTHQVMAGVYDAVEAVSGGAEVCVEPCWDPAWTEDCMSDDARRRFEEARQRLRARPDRVAMQVPTSIAKKLKGEIEISMR